MRGRSAARADTGAEPGARSRTRTDGRPRHSGDPADDPAPRDRARRGRVTALARVPTALWAIAASVAVAAVAWAVAPVAFPAYDFATAISAGQDLLAGREAVYQVPGVRFPMPHPLGVALGTFSALFGDRAFAVFSAVSLLFFGLLCWSVFELARRSFNWPAGLLAAAIIFFSGSIFGLAIRGYNDVKFAALVILAAVLEAGRPKRGWPVLTVVGVAGLLRPEAWILAGLYWIYLLRGRSWRSRIALGAIVAAAPALWILHDLLLTADPFFSFSHAEEWKRLSVAWGADSAVSPLDLPGTALGHILDLDGPAVLAGAVVGAVAAWMARSRGAGVAAVTGVAALVAIAVLVGFGTVVYRRFFIVPASVLAILCAGGVFGWIGLGSGMRRKIMAAAAAALAVALVVTAWPALAKWSSRNETQRAKVRQYDELRGLVLSANVRSEIAACPPVFTPNFVYRPYLRYWLDVPPRAVAFGFPDGPPQRGIVVMESVGLESAGRDRGMFGGEDNALMRKWIAAGRFREIARAPDFVLFAARDCRGAGR